jgi:ubiquitin C-terminal hydrolase
VPELEYLQLQFPPIQRRAATLEDGLKMFLGKETLLPGDEWNCSHCKKLTRSQKQLFLCNLPNYFFITLKRFVGKKGAGVFVNERIDRIFEVPFEHNFGQSGVYRLYAAICHYAGKVGHFVAYCRPNAMQPWFRCDDQTCKEASEHQRCHPLHLSMPSLRTFLVAIRYKWVLIYTINCLILQ